MILSPATLRRRRYTGLSYDCGRTSLPYAAWVKGWIIYWAAKQTSAWERLRKEVRSRKALDSARGKLVFTR